MATNASRRARERKLRARYRRKIFTTGLIMLIIGAVACYVLLAMDIIPEWEELGIQIGKEESLPEEVLPTPTPELTSAPVLSLEMEATEEPVITMAPTAEPTAVPTEVPTAVPTAVPTEVPTAVPTMAPTAVPATAEPEVSAEPEEAVTLNLPAEGGLTIIGGEEAVYVEEPTATPIVIIATPEPTAEPAPAAEPVIVPYGEAVTFDTQINADGTARHEVSGSDFETLNLTLNVDSYMDPAYFEAHYSDTYDLQGTEAAVELGVTLNGYTGTAEVIPQNFLLITFVGKDESQTSQGYQLMDKEIGGKTEIAVTSDTPATLYKRYPYDANQGDMEYMVVTAYNEGQQSVYWFEIHDPNPEPTATPAPEGLTVGSTGTEVTRLQAKLIELGLLQGQPDGKFGKFTAEAVKTMQGRYGMEKTGIADDAFLNRLYN